MPVRIILRLLLDLIHYFKDIFVLGRSCRRRLSFCFPLQLFKYSKGFEAIITAKG